MAVNSLNNLIGSLYASLDVVSRELVGAIPCATSDAALERVAVGQQVISHLSPTVSATDIAPGMLPPDDGEQTFGNVTLTIQKSRRVPFRWTGEQERAINAAGVGVAALRNDQMIQAMRALVNEMEIDVVNAARVNASRAYGTAGTTPFATGVGDTAQLRKILDDNGAPLTDRALIIDTSAGANFRTNTQLTKANESGSIVTMRDGELLNLHGFSLHESAGVKRSTKGTASGFTTNTTGYAVGSTDINVITGTGQFKAGDVVTFAGQTHKYVVAANQTGPGVLKLAAPGLQEPIPAAATAVTVGADFTPNVAFTQSSLIFCSRLPALPDGGDSAVDRTIITDPRSGISFEVAMYAQYRQMQYEISAAWGTKSVKSEHTALLLG
jgi:hypothetical protein